MFWALAGFGCLLIDRDRARAKLAAKVAALGPGRPRGVGPGLGLRPFRILAGVCLGLCCGTKWSGVYFLAVFAVMSMLWDVGARRAAGVRALAARWRATRRRHRLPVHRAGRPRRLPGQLGRLVPQHQRVRPAVGRAASVRPLRLDPRLAALAVALPPVDVPLQHDAGLVPPVPRQPVELADPGPPDVVLLRRARRRARTAATSPSARRRSPRWGRRPSGGGRPWPSWCCSSMWLLRRDWRAGAVLAGLAGGYLPWFQYQHRTIFTFYTVAFSPWIVLTVTFVIGMALGPPTASRTAPAAGRLGGRRLPRDDGRASSSSTGRSTPPRSSRTPSGPSGCGSPAGSSAGERRAGHRPLLGGRSCGGSRPAGRSRCAADGTAAVPNSKVPATSMITSAASGAEDVEVVRAVDAGDREAGHRLAARAG